MQDGNLSLEKIASQVAVDLVKGVFSTSFRAVDKAADWLASELKLRDFFGTTARMYADKLVTSHDVIRILGMSKPVKLRDVYVRVNVLDKLASRTHATVDYLESIFDRDSRSFTESRQTHSGLDAVKKHQRLMVLGKPGSGKTTFLKSLVLAAIHGEFGEGTIPVFINLKNWTDAGISLFDYIHNEFKVCGIPIGFAELFVKQLLMDGRCLILLDGLDEVSADVGSAIQQVVAFSKEYDTNRYVISCRIAAHNYIFEQFTDVEVADFDNGQIRSFIDNWFSDKIDVAEQMHSALREDQNTPIKELACIPLLLTMLCLTFEELLGFPASRSELYEEATRALLAKWDASRGINRLSRYGSLTLKQKELLLSRVSYVTFDKSMYFVQQRLLEHHIADFISNLPGVDAANIASDSEEVLKAIEAQHGLFVERAKGIYSYSHLTIQEYFAARHIVNTAAHGLLDQLVHHHWGDNRWREVIILASGMLPDAGDFLLSARGTIAAIISEFPRIQNLSAISHDIVDLPSETPAAVRRCAGMLCFLVTARRTPETKERSTAIAETARLAKALVRFFPEEGKIDTMKMQIPLDLESVTVWSDDEFIALARYLSSTALLLDCIRAACYVPRGVRLQLEMDLLSDPAGDQ